MFLFREFQKILLENGFPEEVTVQHLRKKWAYTYDVSCRIYLNGNFLIRKNNE